LCLFENLPLGTIVYLKAEKQSLNNSIDIQGILLSLLLQIMRLQFTLLRFYINRLKEGVDEIFLNQFNTTSK
jgi:hypothetical protein